MPISTENMLHGAAIITLLESLDTLDEEITYRLSNGETKSCYQLSLTNEKKTESLKIGLFLKRSRKRISPWRYTFSKDNQHEIERLLKATNYLFVLLITDQEGVAVIDYPMLKMLLDDHFEESESISVSRKLRENYRVSGTDGKLDKALPKNSFPRAITEYIAMNFYKDKKSKKSKDLFSRVIGKLNKLYSKLND